MHLPQIHLHTIGLSLLRFGLAFVFLWFGFSQLQDPLSWIGYLPSWVSGLSIPEVHFVLLNGWFEVVAATLLIFGVYTRFVALLLSLHLLGITAAIGMTAIGVRDLGLSFATLTLSFLGSGAYAIEGLNDTARQLPPAL